MQDIHFFIFFLAIILLAILSHKSSSKKLERIHSSFTKKNISDFPLDLPWVQLGFYFEKDNLIYAYGRITGDSGLLGESTQDLWLKLALFPKGDRQLKNPHISKFFHKKLRSFVTEVDPSVTVTEDSFFKAKYSFHFTQNIRGEEYIVIGIGDGFSKSNYGATKNWVDDVDY